MHKEFGGQRVPSDVWTEDDSFDFIKYGHLFVPQDKTVETIISSVLGDNRTPRKMIEFGCGAGRLMFALLEKFPGVELRAVDKSEAMLDAARDRCRAHGGRVRFTLADFEDTSIFGEMDRYDGAFSVLAIHHLTDDEKRSFFRRIHNALNPGGVFVYCDMFKPNSPAGWKIAAEEWQREVAEQGRRYGAHDALKMFEDLKWNYYANPEGDPSDRPSSLFDVVRWLIEAGFSKCDLHWFAAGHGLISAWK